MPDNQVNEIILDELRGLRSEVRDGFNETLQRMTAVETITRPFFEKDGEKAQIKAEIQDLKRSKYVVLGGATVVGTMFHYVLKKFGL